MCSLKINKNDRKCKKDTSFTTYVQYACKIYFFTHRSRSKVNIQAFANFPETHTHIKSLSSTVTQNEI